MHPSNLTYYEIDGQLFATAVNQKTGEPQTTNLPAMIETRHAHLSHQAAVMIRQGGLAERLAECAAIQAHVNREYTRSAAGLLQRKASHD